MPRKTAKAELTTARLRLRWLTEDDATLLLAIWNDPDFIRHVGDRGIRTPTEALQAMRDGILKLYADFGYGPYLVESLDGESPMGLCGLFKRENLDYPDIGYSLLPGAGQQPLGTTAGKTGHAVRGDAADAGRGRGRGAVWHYVLKLPTLKFNRAVS
jgi:RimJ/RimL family protein N-acetyltransferase